MVEATVTLIKHDFEKGTPHCFFVVVVVVVFSTFFGEKLFSGQIKAIISVSLSSHNMYCRVLQYSRALASLFMGI